MLLLTSVIHCSFVFVRNKRVFCFIICYVFYFGQHFSLNIIFRQTKYFVAQTFCHLHEILSVLSDIILFVKVFIVGTTLPPLA